MGDSEMTPDKEFARRLQAAYISNFLGVTVAYALNKYVPAEPLEYFLILAAQIQRNPPIHPFHSLKI